MNIVYKHLGTLKSEVTYILLESDNVLRCHGIRLCDHRNQVDARAESFHGFNVKRLQPNADVSTVREEGEKNSRMPVRRDEVDASMYPHIHLFHSMRLLFLTHEVFMLVVEEVDDRSPAAEKSEVSVDSEMMLMGLAFLGCPRSLRIRAFR